MGLLQTFLACSIPLRLELVIVYSRAYRNVSADALTRQSVAQIAEWASRKEFTWIELPGVRGAFCASAIPGNLANDLSPICVIPRSGLGLRAAEWDPIGYHAINSMLNSASPHFRFALDIPLRIRSMWEKAPRRGRQAAVSRLYSGRVKRDMAAAISLIPP